MSYYSVPRNLLTKFKDDTIDETRSLAQLLSSNSAINSMLDLSIPLLPGDHGLPLLQAFPNVPPAISDAGGLLANLIVGIPWENVAEKVGSTFGIGSNILHTETSKEMELPVDAIAT